MGCLDARDGVSGLLVPRRRGQWVAKTHWRRQMSCPEISSDPWGFINGINERRGSSAVVLHSISPPKHFSSWWWPEAEILDEQQGGQFHGVAAAVFERCVWKQLIMVPKLDGSTVKGQLNKHFHVATLFFFVVAVRWLYKRRAQSCPAEVQLWHIEIRNNHLAVYKQPYSPPTPMWLQKLLRTHTGWIIRTDYIMQRRKKKKTWKENLEKGGCQRDSSGSHLPHLDVFKSSTAAAARVKSLFIGVLDASLEWLAWQICICFKLQRCLCVFVCLFTSVNRENVALPAVLVRLATTAIKANAAKTVQLGTVDLLALSGPGENREMTDHLAQPDQL